MGNLEWFRTHPSGIIHQDHQDNPMRTRSALSVQVHELIKRRRVGDGFRRVWGGEAQVVEDLFDHGPVCNERDDAHATAAFGTHQRVFAPNLADELSPSFSAITPVGCIGFVLRGCDRGFGRQGVVRLVVRAFRATRESACSAGVTAKKESERLVRVGNMLACPSQKLEGVKDFVGFVAGISALSERVMDHAVGRDRHTFLAHWITCDVPRELFLTVRVTA
jgi:hypothetical protein